MDARTRHELKKNELAELLARLGRFATQRGRQVSMVILLVVVILVGYRVWGWNARRTQEQLWRELASAGPGASGGAAAQYDTLRRIAGEADDASIRQWAQLRLACGLLHEAADDGDDPTRVDEAVRVLEALVAPGAAIPQVAAAARYALGGAYEMQGRLEQAEQTYRSLADDEQLEGSPFRNLARSRAEDIGKLRTPVVFVPGARPAASQAASGPTTKPEPVEPVAPGAASGPAPASAPAEPTRTDSSPP